MLVTLNSSVNVFIYIIMGEKFQRHFLQWLAGNGCLCLVRKLSRRDNTEQTYYTQTARHEDIQLRQTVVVQQLPEEKANSRRLTKFFKFKIQERITTNILTDRKSPAANHATNGGISNHALTITTEEKDINSISDECIPFIEKIPTVKPGPTMVVESIVEVVNQT